MTKGSANLEDQKWYHGFRPRKECQRLLVHPGDWLVRASDNNATHRTEIIISFMNEASKFQNLTLSNDHDKWSLTVFKKKDKAPKFDNVSELVAHYQARPTSHVFLKKPVHRPKWMLKHEQMKYDKEKDLLGSGNFCNVYKGKLDTENGVKDVAIKICHGAEDGKAMEEASKERKSMLKEAELMSFYSHDNVIQLFGVACDHPPVVIVMEFCPGGNLQTHLLKMKKNISLGERLVYCYEAAAGMKYLHTNACIHRDLAARNCLISDKGAIKIADFGLSKIAEDLKKDKEKEKDVEEQITQIPLRWMAPESLKKPQVFSIKSDVWSFGVLIYEIFNDGVKPWPNDEPKKIATAIRKGKMPELGKQAPDEVKAVVAKCWDQNPEKRPQMSDIVTELRPILTQHPITAEQFTFKRSATPISSTAVKDGKVTVTSTMETDEVKEDSLEQHSRDG